MKWEVFAQNVWPALAFVNLFLTSQGLRPACVRGGRAGDFCISPKAIAKLAPVLYMGRGSMYVYIICFSQAGAVAKIHLRGNRYEKGLCKVLCKVKSVTHNPVSYIQT